LGDPLQIEYTAGMPIYHITPLEEWERARAAGSYQADSLHSEGFMHCSTREQVIPTANRFYHGRQGLVLLRIEPELLAAAVQYENLEGGETLFPHIYGPLNLEAVSAVAPFPPQAEGIFCFPVSFNEDPKGF
jgi:uncharacterized protein (DUF952 family)